MRQRIALFSLLVPDYDAGIAFYCGKLGFDLVEDVALDADKRWVVVRPKGAGESGLLLAVADGERQQQAIGNQMGGRVGFFLHTDDFDRDHASFAAAGVRFLETPRDEPYGKVAVFEDAFGNRWDLLEPRA
ncbi:VOC family protein [Shinella sp.]|uniref:VOC family protein n=1 Tax=Shinella sp. TaxID=1870904 RepID=UPI0028AEA9E3|nr:VOC family protein [Shinella sp.]